MLPPGTVFITGTDTDVGKTFVSCGILEAAAARGLSTAACKPVAAGARDTGEGLRNGDALALLRRATLPLSYQEVNPLCFERAVAPHVAAALTGRRISVTRLAGMCRGLLLHRADLTVIEGAGGWKVPLNNRELLSDLVREIRVPVVMVVAMRLGCLNQALLTAQAIRQDGLQLAGWIANQTQPGMPCYQENIDALKSWLAAPLLAEIGFVKDFSETSSCAASIDIDRLLATLVPE
ncbi:MAG: dethiobiotin synthase [Pseudomonadales bacterium]|nr:dethiobiotin synthase [Pseudomonadales bacterium]